jgi:predicted CoA-binding protein
VSNIIRSFLLNAKNIVIIGASTNPKKDSYKVMKFFQEEGFRVLPINSQTSNKKILGERIYKNIDEIDIDIDIVNIFRPSSEIAKLVDRVVNKKVKTVWLQLEIFCIKSEQKLNLLGINFIQNKCIKIEYEKLKKK